MKYEEYIRFWYWNIVWDGVFSIIWIKIWGYFYSIDDRNVLLFIDVNIDLEYWVLCIFVIVLVNKIFVIFNII